MFALKSSLLLALFTVSAKLVVAVPPACLLAAVNTESAPADLPTVCGPDASKVKSQIKSLCGANTKAALTAFDEVCKGVSPSSSSSGSPSSTGSASVTGSPSASLSSDLASASGTASPSSTDAPYPVVYTSTYYNTECSCTKTAHISSTGISGGSSGFVTGTAVGTAGITGSGVTTSPIATGSPIVPTVSPSATSPTSPSFTGGATKSGCSLAIAALVAAGLAVSL